MFSHTVLERNPALVCVCAKEEIRTEISLYPGEGDTPVAHGDRPGICLVRVADELEGWVGLEAAEPHLDS